MRRYVQFVFIGLLGILFVPSCRKRKTQAPPSTPSLTSEFEDPGRVIREFREHFHDSKYLFDELLHGKDQKAVKQPYVYVQHWYKRLGLHYGSIEDRLAYEYTKVYVEGEPQEVSGLMVFKTKFEVPNVERIYLQVPWLDEGGKALRQEDAFHDVFSVLAEEDRLPRITRELTLRLKNENGRWWIWEDFEGLVQMVKGEDRYHEQLEAVEVEVKRDEISKAYAVNGLLRNKGNRCVYRVQILIQFKDESGKPVGNIVENHLFDERTLDPGYASGFRAAVGRETDYDWYDAWDKESVVVTVVGADALPLGIRAGTKEKIENRDEIG